MANAMTTMSSSATHPGHRFIRWFTRLFHVLLLHATRRIDGAVLWANLHLLFWLSLFPFVTGWMGENHFAPLPMALYGVVLLFAACAYWLLQQAIMRVEGRESLLAKALGDDRKGNFSPFIYLVAIPGAFIHPAIAGGLYILVALIWLIPDRRIERVLSKEHG